MYRFIVSLRWAGYAAAALATTAVMVLLGDWQWQRYEERTARNARIAAGDNATPTPLGDVLARPGVGGDVGPPPAADQEWAAVAVTGRYDATQEVLVRGRTVNGRVGFEILTPLVLADETAVLVNRGFLPAPPGDASARPVVPPAPSGQVDISGRVRFSESGPRPLQRRDGRIEVRRISLDQLARELPYPLFNAYLVLTVQKPPADPALAAVPIRTDNAWQSGAYAVQWWVFALMVAGWFAWSVRREAHRDGSRHGGASAATTGTERIAHGPHVR